MAEPRYRSVRNDGQISTDPFHKLFRIHWGPVASQIHTHWKWQPDRSSQPASCHFHKLVQNNVDIGASRSDYANGKNSRPLDGNIQ